ncbi:sensor histidine kinase [Fluviispira sanaruensis]|uniref:histidine kinase n=1 Tax=Fluviispira sanaruensis TaxID=2493639 RepID=A0A4P2VM35_FLUSA|nr:HAMP domain-containing sensor histidine kinase [Fluviispira sanaruensis]BBH52900.1 sensor histidine kinase [Fluviispira sanaruensis]
MSVRLLQRKISGFILGHGFPDENRTKLTWLIRLRWLAILSQMICLHFALNHGWINRAYISVYLFTIVNLAFLNACAFYLTRKLKNISNGIIFFQLLCDLSAVTFLLILTGGAWNPFLPIIFLHISLGAILLRGRTVLIFCLIVISSVLLLHSPADMPPALSKGPTSSQVLIPSQIMVSLLIFILTYWLTCSLSLQKKFSEKLQAENNRIDKLRALGALSSGFSHEFATPLNTIKLRIERLARKNQLYENDDYKTILKAVSQCENAIRQMSNSSLSNEKTNFEKKNIAQIIKDISRSWNSKTRNASVYINENAEKVECFIPVLAFTKAFVDILDNAEQATISTNKAYEFIPILVTLSIENKYISLSILDEGSGWPEVVQKYAGQPFVTTKTDGVGLGLYNAFTFASAVGGHFLLENNIKQGACARFLIPIYEGGQL